MGKSGSAPEADPRIGEAAMMSAKTGVDYLDFMRSQAAISNTWADEDRARYKNTFEPLQDAYIAEAQRGPDYGKVAGDVRRAGADVSMAFAGAQGQADRRLAARGVTPGSGAAMGNSRRMQVDQALATAGAQNNTRLASRGQAEAKADLKQSNAINIGSGLAVNPGTSLGIGSNAMSSGFQGAMQGYGQQGRLLNTQYQQQLQSWQANQAQSASMWGGVGNIVGGLFAMSSEDYKTGKTPARGALKAVKAMPAKEYRYKPGIEDGGSAQHVGPMAEDFHAATGAGDGKTIPLQDAVGVTMGAVQELSDKVDALSKQMGGRGPIKIRKKEAAA